MTNAYFLSIEDFRARKDAHFRSRQGPIPPAQLATFAGLSYYPPDSAWRFVAAAEPGSGEAVVLGTSTGEDRVMVQAAHARLKTPAGELVLSLYAPPGDDQPARLFLPFRDATSGHETYGAGRYLDAPLEGGQLTLDFNLAYHPYCAYGDGWTCPLPPPENWLRVPVRVGERNAVRAD